MLQEKIDLTNGIKDMDFPSDADIRISIAGLAFCQLDTEESQVHFLSQVPHHKLDLTIIQRRRDSDTPIFLLNTRVDINHTILIRADNSITPPNIAVAGDYPLSEIINISQLHGGKKIIKYIKDIPADFVPVKLTVQDCGFYTLLMTNSDFNIIETLDDREVGIVATKKIGYAMGGKIQCRAGGNIEIQVKGSNSLSIVRPLKDAEGDFVYDIILNNHCVDITKCEEEMMGEGDFKYYYDLLQDPITPGRKFKLQKVSGSHEVILSTDVAACNVVITEPPSN